MTETRCDYHGDRGDALIAYLYDDIAGGERASFEDHLATCQECRVELDALRGIRAQLGRWTPPQPQFAVGESRVEGRGSRFEGRSRWQAIPVWAQVAAAMLVLGVSAGLANLNIHYGADGLTVRTGWSDGTDARLKARATNAEVAQGVSRATPTANATANDPTPWRADLAALEQQLRSELRASAVAAHPVASRSLSDDELVRRLRAMIADSERRQQRELALRVAGVVSDINVARAADLARVRQTLGAFESTTGAELLKQRQQLVNYLTQVSLKR